MDKQTTCNSNMAIQIEMYNNFYFSVNTSLRFNYKLVLRYSIIFFCFIPYNNLPTTVVAVMHKKPRTLLTVISISHYVIFSGLPETVATGILLAGEHCNIICARSVSVRRRLRRWYSITISIIT